MESVIADGVLEAYKVLQEINEKFLNSNIGKETNAMKECMRMTADMTSKGRPLRGRER